MISRIYVGLKGKDVRSSLYVKSFNALHLSGKVKRVEILDSYLIKHNLGNKKLEQVAEALSNPILERYSIGEKLPRGLDFKYAVEIGFLPGVTDNVGHTARETILDLLRLKNTTALEVYTSKVFLISGTLHMEDVNKIALSLYNPLIERSHIIKIGQKLPNKVPEVMLKKRDAVINVSLNVSDGELIKIGKEGILDKNGSRRGPLALDLASMKVIRDYFNKLPASVGGKRDPTDIELESLAQTWSEHCKHTIFANQIDDIKDGLYKTYIQGATNLIRKQKGRKDFCISVFSDNSGGIIFDKDYLITHKVETHNSPSALDPFGGAITGIVGVNRDTIGFGLGAKPVANVYGFCFGNPEDNRALFRDKNLKNKMLPPKRIMDGVIKGINVGGNCSGIPTLSGFVKYDDRYRGKPLVFAGTVGIMPRKIKGKLMHEKKARAGDYIVVIGGRVGKDGIHGATFSSVAMDSSSPATAVQIGDPITQKKLSDAVVKEARDMGLYNSITDNGAGGISCSVAEMGKESGGAKVYLEKVPLKYPGLRPWEIWISESQERMTLAVPPSKYPKFQKLMVTRGVETTVIGEFTNSGKCIVRWKGKAIMNMDMEFLHNGLPKQPLKSIKVINKNSEPKIPKNISYSKTLEKMLGAKNIGGFSFISEQYDHEVQASSVLKPLSGAGRINTDAQIFKPVLTSNRGVVLSSGVYPSYGDISTYDMATCAIDTAIRNTVACGGKLSHLAILDNFCWCSSHDPKRLGELKEATRACYDVATGFGTPFISGKDSMFNDFKGYDERGNSVSISIPPTLLISAISVMPDLCKAVSPEFKNIGDAIYLLGETNDELGGGEYYKLLGAVGNSVPKVNLKKNIKTYLALEKAIDKELINSSISLTSGGLAVALAKASVGGMLGCNVSIKNLPGNLSGGNSSVVKLFSESQGRILVSVSPKNTKAFEKIMKGIPYAKIGKVAKDGKLTVTHGGNSSVVNTNVKKLHSIYHKFSNNEKS